MGRADLHIHTRVSDGLCSVEQVLEAVHEAGELDVIAVTDHEDVAGGQRAREAAAKRGYAVQVVVGAEVTTLHGHVLALFVERCPRSFRTIESTLYDIHRQGGVAIVPHPMSWLTRSVSRRTIERLVARGEPGLTIDGLETYNPSPAGRATAARARALNERWGLPETGSSDAHHLPHVGSGWTSFAGTTAEELRTALTEGRVQAGMRGYASMREVGLRQTALGLVWGYSATPRKMLRRRQPELGRER